MSGLVVRFFLFFILCTSSILLSEHYRNTPWTREEVDVNDGPGVRTYSLGCIIGIYYMLWVPLTVV